MNIVIAIHSPGAMGSAISARLVARGARVLTSLDGRSAATVERAAAAGMEDASPETITTADLILSIVPPGEAVALAEGFVKRLSESRHKPVFIDCNALSPKTKTQVAVTLALHHNRARKDEGFTLAASRAAAHPCFVRLALICGRSMVR